MKKYNNKKEKEEREGEGWEKRRGRKKVIFRELIIKNYYMF